MSKPTIDVTDAEKLRETIAVDVANRFADDNGTDKCFIPMDSCHQCAYKGLCLLHTLRLCADAASSEVIRHFFDMTDRRRKKEGGES